MIERLWIPPGAGLFSINDVIEEEILLLTSFLFPIIIIITIICQHHKVRNKPNKEARIGPIKKVISILVLTIQNRFKRVFLFTQSCF